ncbi:MAG TPA: hypothetical protein VHG52_02065, partial [Thermomicrobiales bacterium]|nr:hypothetical protein [Thermomicrobiales bacterium]
MANTMMLRPQPIQAKGFVQHEAGSEFVEGWRSGSLEAARAFVRSRQAESLLVAWLLTMDSDRARGLAAASLLTFLREPDGFDPDADPRLELLAAAGRCFLTREYDAVPATQSHQITHSEREHLRIETGRDRTLAALGRLSESERLALVLSEVAGLDEREVNRVLGQSGVESVVQRGQGQRRMRQTLDLPPGDSVRPMLLEAGFDRPRDDLWPHLEGPLSRIQCREQRRRRMISLGFAGVVLLVSLVTAAVLFGDDLLGDGSDPADQAVNVPAVEDDLDIRQSVPILPTPTPSPTPMPAGEVPNTLLAEIRHDPNSEDSYTSLAIY